MSNTYIPYVIKTNGSITMYLNRESATIAIDHPNYSKVVDALKTGQFELIDKLINISKSIESYTSKNSGKVKIDNGIITYENIPLNSTLTTRIIKMMSEGFKFDHMVKFLENLLNNPSKRAVEELYTFLENSGLPITDDGCFLAYKAVRNDYKDIYSGTISNKPGESPKMPRNCVDDEYNQDCSHGLHVGALEYVTKYGHFVLGAPVDPSGNRLLIVKVNPANVVSVPKYEKFPKMRVCEYQVIDEIKDVVKELEKIVYKSDGSEFPPDNQDDSDIEDMYDDVDDYVDDESTHNYDENIVASSTFSPESYKEGFAAGLDDVDRGENYGWSRDYSRNNSYRIGYNDAYTNRPNRLETEHLDSEHNTCDCENCTCENNPEYSDAEFSSGYSVGRYDAEMDNVFEFSLDADDSVFFDEGYRSGYYENLSSSN